MINSPTEALAINQLLHGYSEGHRLLQASMKLPDDLTRQLLRLSDLSGHSQVEGFEDYLTAYPVQSLYAFALAKTWAAPEMPRPGCVWTQTLIIPNVIISEVSDLRVFLQLFRRPKSQKDFSQYESTLDLPSQLSLTVEANIPDLYLIERLLQCYYSFPRSAIILPSQSSKEFESAVFGLWTQQWPSLRSQMTFCTGSLSSRTANKKTFQIQCCPVSLARELQREVQSTSETPVVLTKVESLPSNTKWLKEAADDCSQSSSGKLRRFLRENAINRGREDFVSLVEGFELMEQDLTIMDRLRLLAQKYPAPEDGQALKLMVLGDNKRSTEIDLLSEIATTSFFRSIDSKSLNLKNRAELFCDQPPAQVRTLLNHLFVSSLNPLGEEIVAGVISSLSLSLAREVIADRPHFLPALFRGNPKLASNGELWALAGSRKRDLLEAMLENNALSEDLIPSIVEAMLEGEGDYLIRPALDKWGKFAVFGILNAINRGKWVLNAACRGALTFHIKTVADWFETSGSPNATARVAVARIVGPYTYEIKSRDSSVWIETLKVLEEGGSPRDVIYVKAVCLALGLQNAQPNPIKLLELAFNDVHEHAKRDEMTDDEWIVLDPLVPHLFWLHDWDKCERLRRGIAESFVRFRWSPNLLSQVAQRGDLMDEIKRSALRVKGGEQHFF